VFSDVPTWFAHWHLGPWLEDGSGHAAPEAGSGSVLEWKRIWERAQNSSY